MATYSVRVVSIYATHWRKNADVPTPPGDSFDLGKLQAFYDLFKEQMPAVLSHTRLPDGALTLGGGKNPVVRVTSAELFLFALPFPANQVVTALAIDVDSPDVNEHADVVRTVLECTANAQVAIDGVDLPMHVENLCTGSGMLTKKKGPNGELVGLPIERHQLVFIGDLNGIAPPQRDVIASVLYGVMPPYREGFAKLKEPDGLKQQDGTFAAVTASTSLLYGHKDDVETSVFLTTVQAVGTASRFQQIWQDAYHAVQQFQMNGQAHEAGKQQRKGLGDLADEMGNLELDLAFSVEAAADLGAPIPSYAIVTFHDDLYDVMQIRARAHTVSQMFVRLGGSIRSELTAIESRERAVEDARRRNVAVAFGAVSFVAIPIGFVLGFFGINAAQIHQDASMWSWHYYWWVYLVAALLMVLPLLWGLVASMPPWLARLLPPTWVGSPAKGR